MRSRGLFHKIARDVESGERVHAQGALLVRTILAQDADRCAHYTDAALGRLYGLPEG